MKRWIAPTLLALAAVLPWVVGAEAKEKEGPALRWATSWKDAVLQARDRNAVLFATFHKDNWGPCANQHRSVLENEDFVKYANENIVCVVGHNDTGHEAEVEDAKGNKTPGCALYPGLQCKQHQSIMGEVGRPPEGMPRIELPNGVPNSWLVAPDGTVEAIDPADQQSAGKVQELCEALQKKAGKAIGWKDYGKLQDAFEAAAKAVEGGDWKAAITACQAVEKRAAKMPPSVGERLAKQVDELNAKVAEAFEAARGEADAVQRDRDVKALRAKVSAKIGPKALPVLAEIDAWLKANPVAPAK